MALQLLGFYDSEASNFFRHGAGWDLPQERVQLEQCHTNIQFIATNLVNALPESIKKAWSEELVWLTGENQGNRDAIDLPVEGLLELICQ